MCRSRSVLFFFFFNDTATTEIYTLSLHDALPIYAVPGWTVPPSASQVLGANLNCSESCFPRWRGRSLRCGISILPMTGSGHRQDRKSTRLNSSHGYISYAVFCLKKKKNQSRPRAHSFVTLEPPPMVVTSLQCPHPPPYHILRFYTVTFDTAHTARIASQGAPLLS